MGSALFVGREKEIEDLRMEYLEADQGIAKTIWGLPGTGKTELVNQVFSEEELAKYDDIFYWNLSLTKFSDYRSFWIRVLSDLNDFLKARGFNDLDSSFQKYLMAAENAELSNEIWEFTDRIVNLAFKEADKNGIRSILVIDDFHYAKTIFRELPHFSLINDIQQYNASVLLLSARQMKDIVPESGSLFERRFEAANTLRQFNAEEAKAFWEKAKEIYGIELSEEDQENVSSSFGGFPWLLSIFLDGLKREKKKADKKGEAFEPDIESIFEDKHEAIRLHFDKVYETLSESKDKWIESIIPFVIGPKAFADKEKRNDLLKKGFIEEDVSSEGYHSFCDYFRGFLRRALSGISTFDKLDQFTQKIRSLVRRESVNLVRTLKGIGLTLNDIEMSNLLFANAANLKGIINWDKFIANEKRDRGNDASFLEVQNLEATISLIKKDWSLFSKYFENRPYSDFEEEFAKIADARDPLAHSNAHFLTESERFLVESSCEQIGKIIDGNWRKGPEKEPTPEEIISEARKNLPANLQRVWTTKAQNANFAKGDWVPFTLIAIQNPSAKSRTGRRATLIGIVTDSFHDPYLAECTFFDYSRLEDHFVPNLGKLIPEKARIYDIDDQANRVIVNFPFNKQH